MSNPETTGWRLEPGIGLCKVCDDSAMRDTARYGAPIPGDECGGCGAQTYECWLKDEVEERNLRRVDVEGFPVMVLRYHAREHLEEVNRKLAVMKMALHRIKRLGEAGTAQLAEEALEAVSGRAALLRDFVENQDG